MPSGGDRIYALTELGRRQGSDVRPGNRDNVIDYLFNNKTARLTELAGSEGKDERQMHSAMRQYERRGLVHQLTS